MTSRERLLSVLRGELPDRVPISTYELVPWNPGSWESSQPSYARLMDYIRENTDCMYMWGPTMVDPPYGIEVSQKQWREGKSTFRKLTYHTEKGDLTQVHREDDDVNTAWCTEHLLKDVEDIEKYVSILDCLAEVDLDASTRSYGQARDNVGDNGIILTSIADPLGVAAFLWDFAEYTVIAVTETERFVAFLDAIFERLMDALHKMLDAGIGELFRICGPEAAVPPYLPPGYFGRFVTPYITKMVELIHEHGQYVRFHCHGRVRDALPEMLKTGSDATDPVEPPPLGDITLAEAKDLCGDRLCIMGNLELRDLETLKPEEMAEIVKQAVLDGKPGGRFVVMPTACPINVPLSPVTEQNYMTFIDTALEYGGY